MVEAASEAVLSVVGARQLSRRACVMGIPWRNLAAEIESSISSITFLVRYNLNDFLKLFREFN